VTHHDVYRVVQYRLYWLHQVIRYVVPKVADTPRACHLAVKTRQLRKLYLLALEQRQSQER
jgi:hypothetical protein